MTQKPDPDTDPAKPTSDDTRGAIPKIQPVLVGLVLAAIIAAIVLTAFCTR